LDTIWNEIFKELGIFSILVFAIAWLSKKTLEFYIAQDIETYKSDLSKTSVKEIELFKAQLQSTAKEHDIRYTKLQEKRIEVISELYGLLWEAHQSATYFNMDFDMDVRRYEFDKMMSKLPPEIVGNKQQASPEKILSKKEAAQEAYRKIVKFEAFFRGHKLFFSKELSTQVEDLINILEQIPFFYMVVDNQKDDFLDKAKEELKRWNEQGDAIEQTLEMIEKEFRHLIGSDEEGTSLKNMREA
jgi:hypothetical protein